MKPLDLKSTSDQGDLGERFGIKQGVRGSILQLNALPRFKNFGGKAPHPQMKLGNVDFQHWTEESSWQCSGSFPFPLMIQNFCFISVWDCTENVCWTTCHELCTVTGNQPSLISSRFLLKFFKDIVLILTYTLSRHH